MIPNEFKYFCLNEMHLPYADNSCVTSVKCSIFSCLIHDSCYFSNDIKKSNIIANCIFIFLLDRPFYNKSDYWYFYYEENNTPGNGRYINTYQLFLKYPINIIGKTDLCLKLIGLHLGNISKDISSTFIERHYRIFLPEDKLTGYYTMLDFLVQRGLIFNYKLTVEGWKRFDEITNKNASSNQLFIASQFEGFDEIIGVVKDSVIECGYSPVYMKDHQTNNYIMPEIFSLIDNSKAVIGEISSNNNGVYFEIGYAKGKGIEVILICKAQRDDNGKLITKTHFDVSQISIIYYDDKEDLKKKLKFRIENTISKS